MPLLGLALGLSWAEKEASPPPSWREGPPGAREEGQLETAGFHLEALFIWPGMEKGWGQSAYIPMETAMSLAPGGPRPWWGMRRPSRSSGAPLAKGPGFCLGSSSYREVWAKSCRTCVDGEQGGRVGSSLGHTEIMEWAVPSRAVCPMGGNRRQAARGGVATDLSDRGLPAPLDPLICGCRAGP